MPVQFRATAHYDGFGDSHNIVINEGTGYAFAVGTNTFAGGLHIVDVRDPANPTAAGGFSQDGYTHDAQCIVCECRFRFDFETDDPFPWLRAANGNSRILLGGRIHFTASIDLFSHRWPPADSLPRRI